MNSLWCDQTAQAYPSELDLRVYTSRLLGADASLVLHGGGNTSVKVRETDLFGEEQEILYVKGSGWDLATIEAAGFAPVRMDVLLKMAQLETLSDSDMVTHQRAAMTDPNAPNPSVEAILHAVIPYQYVDHSHADAVVTLTNTPEGEALIRQVYGQRVVIIPYVMPGFELAKLIHRMTRDLDWSSIDGLVLMNHGLFTFADDARRSYEQHIELVSEAEAYIAQQGVELALPTEAAEVSLPHLAQLRRSLSKCHGRAVIAHLNDAPLAREFSNRDVPSLASRGTLTPEHVIRTKRSPVFLQGDTDTELSDYVARYRAYFEAHRQPGQQCLNPAPAYAVWQGNGAISVGKSLKEAQVIRDINDHTFEAILKAEQLGGYRALDEATLFEIEYWELEQAKLKKSAGPVGLSGKVALVVGLSPTLAKAVADRLKAVGAEVVEGQQVQAVDALVRTFGGLDLLVGDLAAVDQAMLDSALEIMQWGIDPLVINLGTASVGVNPPLRCHRIEGELAERAEAVATLVEDLAGAGFNAIDSAKVSF